MRESKKIYKRSARDTKRGILPKKRGRPPKTHHDEFQRLKQFKAAHDAAIHDMQKPNKFQQRLTHHEAQKALHWSRILNNN